MRVCIHTTLYDSKIQASTSSYSYSVYNMYMVMYEFVSILRARKKTRNFGISDHDGFTQPVRITKVGYGVGPESGTHTGGLRADHHLALASLLTTHVHNQSIGILVRGSPTHRGEVKILKFRNGKSASVPLRWHR